MFSNYSKFLNSLIYAFLIVTAFALYTSKKIIEFVRRGMTLFGALADALENISRGPYLNSLFLKRPLSRRKCLNQCIRGFSFPLLIFITMSILVRLMTKASPRLVFPISVVVGFIGYKVENWISDKYTPSLKSVKEKREERLLNEEKELGSLKDAEFVPKTIFEKNLSPSLAEPDPRLNRRK